MQDIGAFIDLYNSAPPEQKLEFGKSLDLLKHRLTKETTEALQWYNPEITKKPFTAEAGARRKEMLSLHFAKDVVREDPKNLPARYAISSLKAERKMESRIFSQSKPVTRLPSARRAKSSRGFNQLGKDKFGRTGYLGRLDVTKLVRGSSAMGIKRPQTKNVRYNVSEVERQFRKSTSSIRMRKEAEILNYNPADNAVLIRQIQMIRSFDALPKFIPRKHTEAYC